MRLRARRRSFLLTATLLLATAGACGNRLAPDPNNREVAWSYGPTNGGASPEHVQGTGANGGTAIARGWQCRLQDGKRLVITPYELATKHPLFGKVTLAVGLYDATGAPIELRQAGTVTATTTSFTLDLSDATVARLSDLVFCYVAI